MLLARCPWYIAGPVVGALIVTLRAAVNKPLGALGGYIDFSEHGGRPSRAGFSAFLLAGIVIGGVALWLYERRYFDLLAASAVLLLILLLMYIRRRAGIREGLEQRIQGRP